VTYANFAASAGLITDHLPVLEGAIRENRALANNFDPQNLATAVDDVSRITPVWDFGAPPWLSERRDL
jgi:hypothetical protein